MSNPRDPRKAGGRFAGPGGAHDRSGIVIDATDAVLLDDVHVAMVEPSKDGQALLPVVALKLAGRINKTQERAEIVYQRTRPTSARRSRGNCPGESNPRPQSRSRNESRST